MHGHYNVVNKVVTIMVKDCHYHVLDSFQLVTTFHKVEVSHINLVVKMLINIHAPSLHACSTPQNWVKKDF